MLRWLERILRTLDQPKLGSIHIPLLPWRAPLAQTAATELHFPKSNTECNLFHDPRSSFKVLMASLFPIKILRSNLRLSFWGQSWRKVTVSFPKWFPRICSSLRSTCVRSIIVKEETKGASQLSTDTGCALATFAFPFIQRFDAFLASQKRMWPNRINEFYHVLQLRITLIIACKLSGSD